MATTRDYSALTTTPTAAEVAAFRRASRATGLVAQTISVVTLVIASLIGIAAIGAFSLIGAGAISVLLSIGQAGGEPAPLLVTGITVLLQVGLVVLVVTIYRRYWRTRWARLYRMTRFARSNGFTFSPRDANPSYPGAIFQPGDSRAAHDHYFATTGRHLDFGNYRFTTGTDKQRATHNWGFLAMRLDRRLPHLVLDARINNGLFGNSNLPITFRSSQTLSLEGDFDRHFTLYCPEGYERDALYILTPDVMATLIDEAGTLDLEIIDDWLFAYSPVPFRMDDPATVGRLLRVADTVGAKTLGQTARYADERHPGTGAAVGSAATAAADSAEREAEHGSLGASGASAGSAGSPTTWANEAATPGGRPPGPASPFTGRLAANTIAPGGRRLRRTTPALFFVITLAAIVIVAGAVLLFPF